MEKVADVVIIGGGILGASTAHFLSRYGFGKVVLLEKATLAAVSTGHSAAAVRTFYSNPITVALAKRALDMFTHSEEAFGGDSGFQRSGYLVLLDETGIANGRRVVELERKQDIQIQELALDDLRTHAPHVNLEGIIYGILEPDSGYADPTKTTQTLVSRAKDWNLSVYQGVGATGIQLNGDRVSAVETKEGTIATPVVVNAAGGWGQQVGRWVGLNDSFRWSRESDIVFEVPFDTEGFPIVSDPQLRFYCRPADSHQILAGLGFPKEIEPLDVDRYDPAIDQPTRERIERLMFHRVPSSRQGRFVRGWASMYTITDDWHPLIGAEPTVPGYFACVAGSGHGFKLGPPLGEALAKVITGQTPDIDIHGFRPNRFIEGDYFTSVWGSGNRA